MNLASANPAFTVLSRSCRFHEADDFGHTTGRPRHSVHPANRPGCSERRARNDAPCRVAELNWRRYGRPRHVGVHHFRGASKRQRALLAFTLIELLVVISVIGLLAGLTVGLSGVAGRKSKEARVRGDLNRLVTLIENYKAKLGSYPPTPESDVFFREANDRVDVPKIRQAPAPDRVFISQLYYELSGTIFTNPPSSIQSGRFFVVGQPPVTGLTAAQILQVFQADGFANSARDKRNVKFTAQFKVAEVKEMAVPGVPSPIQFLSAPVVPPLNPLPGTYVQGVSGGGKAYPWFYDASSPNRINTEGFDLWTVVEIGKKIIRFSNWEDGPVVIGP